MGREHLTYHLVAKITSFQSRDSKRMLQIFLYEESQIYKFKNKYNKKYNTTHICVGLIFFYGAILSCGRKRTK
jgi:hypothetical protein